MFIDEVCRVVEPFWTNKMILRAFDYRILAENNPKVRNFVP